MSTPYSKIYRRFLSKISDYDILTFDVSTQYSIMLDLLSGTCATFDRICKKDLDNRDDLILEFTDDLTSLEQEILAVGMVCSWLEPRVLDMRKLSQFINTKDYYSSSPANLIAQSKEILKSFKREYRFLINQYSYTEGDLETLGT